MKWNGSAWVHDADAQKPPFRRKPVRSASVCSPLRTRSLPTGAQSCSLMSLRDEDKVSLIKWMAYIKARLKHWIFHW